VSSPELVHVCPDQDQAPTGVSMRLDKVWTATEALHGAQTPFNISLASRIDTHA